ncbi:MAG: hypothetical protein Q7R56_00500 [Nanoarchaeota archaeon]|nr:hypothetical protein [Nanoarchaeota archaeon]
MVERKIYWKQHGLALIITIIIFSIGILIGIQLTETRVTELQTKNQAQKADFESLQLQYAFLNTQPHNKSCIAFSKALERNVYDLENTRIKVEQYLQSSSNTEELTQLKRDYSLAEIRYWLLAEQAQQECNSNIISILYFYQKDELCNDCSGQGYILTELKDQFKEKLLIFSFDIDLEEPLVDILQETYNITKGPTLVINGETYQELQTTTTIKKLLCKHYGTIEECHE